MSSNGIGETVYLKCGLFVPATVVPANLYLHADYAKSHLNSGKQRMQSSEDHSALNIIRNIQSLEQLSEQSVIDPSQYDRVYRLVKETAEWTYETIVSEEVDIALQILELLYGLNNVPIA